MNLPFLTSFLIFIFVLTFFLMRGNNLHSKVIESFWEKELAANSTRRKSLDNLPYITIPLDMLPFSVTTTDDKILEYQNAIRHLSREKVVNLTGISNTDLKLEYGAPNLTELTQYDSNFTNLVRVLYQWSQKLYDANQIKHAKTVLEFGVSIRSDVSKHYFLLASIYHDEKSFDKIQHLIDVAAGLNSLSKVSIMNKLNEIIMS